MAKSPEQLATERERSPLPIIVGITGHRDLGPGDIDPLKQKVRSILHDLRRRYPWSRLVVMSPLAEGADRLVAEVALEEMPAPGLSVDLMVPLPLSREEYEKDFETAESRRVFAELLGRASDSFVLPLVEGNTAKSVEEPGPARDKQYAQVGAYIARHSHILIALWDGLDTEMTGGTAQIVGFKLDGVPEPYAPQREPLDVVDRGPVFHIVTPRKKNPSPVGTAFELHVRFPEVWDSSEAEAPPDPASEVLRKSELLAEYRKILQGMNGFNRDAAQLSSKLSGQLAKNRGYVIPDEKLNDLSPHQRFLLDRYALADTLAIHFQKWRRRTLVTLFVIAVLALSSFELYVDVVIRPEMLSLYLLALITALAIFLLAERKNYQNKHLDYRALAEGLRVQLFWSVAGWPDEADEHYLRQHRTELDWIRNAIRAWNIFPPRDGSAGAAEANEISAAELALINDCWVKDQQKFFRRAKDRDHRKLHRRENVVKIFFAFGLLLAFGVLIWHVRQGELIDASHWRGWLNVTMAVLPAVAAAIGGYAEKMAFSAQAKRYDWMNALFTRAARRLEEFIRAGDYHAAQKLVFELGKEALEENGDWVMIHRERKADVYG